jgi:hypothetical protein
LQQVGYAYTQSAIGCGKVPEWKEMGRKETDGFWRPDLPKQTLSSRSDEVAGLQRDTRVRLVAGYGIALESLFANVIMPESGATLPR